MHKSSQHDMAKVTLLVRCYTQLLVVTMLSNCNDRPGDNTQKQMRFSCWRLTHSPRVHESPTQNKHVLPTTEHSITQATWHYAFCQPTSTNLLFFNTPLNVKTRHKLKDNSHYFIQQPFKWQWSPVNYRKCEIIKTIVRPRLVISLSVHPVFTNCIPT